MTKKIIMLGRVRSNIKAGIPSHVFSIIKSFENESDIRFINVVPSINKNLAKKIKLVRLTNYSYEIECKSFFIKKTLGISFIYFYVLLKIIKKNPISKLHLHLPDPLSMLFVIIFAKRKKIIATYHADLINKGIFSYIYKTFLNLLISKNCFFVFPTEKHISSTLLAKKNIKSRVLPFIFKKPKFSNRDLELIKNKFNSKETKLLFVGRHVPYKGVDVLIKAFKDIKKNEKLSLKIVGKGPLTKKLKNLAGNDERIHFLGEVDEFILNKLYCEAHIFVLPSISKAEAFGIVQVEAMMRSCLCLCSYLNNGVNVVNKEGISGRSFKIKKVDELKNLIVEFSENLDKRNSFMKNASIYSFNTFASKSLLYDYKSIY